jgi:cell division protein FtsB
MVFPGVEQMLRDVGMWLEEVRQDVCNVQSDVAALQREAERMRAEAAMLRAELAEIRRKVRLQELAAQEATLVFSAGGEARRRPFALLPKGDGLA